MDGDTPIRLWRLTAYDLEFPESRSLGRERQCGGRFHPRFSTSPSMVAYKYREGKVKSTLERELDVPEIFAQQAIGTLKEAGMCLRTSELPGYVAHSSTSLDNEEHNSQLHHWYVCVSRVQFRACVASVVSAQGAGSWMVVKAIWGPTVCVVL